MSKRVLRRKQQAPLASGPSEQGHSSTEQTPVDDSTNSQPGSIKTFKYGSKLSGLTASELRLLRQKQRKLERTAQETVESLPHPRAGGPRRRTKRGTERDSGPGESRFQIALEASLIFAQYEAGSAVCIHPDGWVLTCAHCMDDSDEDEDEDGGEDETRQEERRLQALGKRVWLLNYTGLAVQAECRAWDPKRDLALLKIVTIEEKKHQQQGNSRSNNDVDTDTAVFSSSASSSSSFPYISLSRTPIAPNVRIICLGQPGFDDLESTTPQRTAYNLVEVSRGRLRGLIEGDGNGSGGADPHDNSAIGSLMHDAWTYWGHSGAPLVREDDGCLTGLHSSWDEQTCMRHGVPLVAIEAFVTRYADMMGWDYSAGGGAEYVDGEERTVIVSDSGGE